MIVIPEKQDAPIVVPCASSRGLNRVNVMRLREGKFVAQGIFPTNGVFLHSHTADCPSKT